MSLAEQTTGPPRPGARVSIQEFEPRPKAELKLYCLPHAGGSCTSYHPWLRRLPARVALRGVQLPGRPHLMDVPSFTSLTDLARATATAVLKDAGGVPFALFGHSMGGLAAYETTVELVQRGDHVPRLLALSAVAAPHRRRPTPPLHLLPEAELIARVRKLGGIPDEILDVPELLELTIPLLRADFAMMHRHTHKSRGHLPTPLSVFGGTEDPGADAAQLADWAKLTRGACSVRTFPGGHFYLNERTDAVLAALLEDLF
ncbi:thioesterase II family protein [Streptomyces sp. NPDC088400]|uniref:thioesterase II family protein n=1 Tax=Streptomyces sp. NPDC088400 TaxID=3365861 RepID=UPI00380ADFC9